MKQYTTGFVYLLRFEQPISQRHTTQHYLGWTDDLATRIQQHRNGGRQAARLCQVAKQRGIRFQVLRVWRGGRELERQLKNQKNGSRLANGQRITGAVELQPEQINQLLIPF